MLILAALLSIIIIICGFFMIYTVYFRFLRLLIIVPMGSIAFSTMGGNRTVNHTVSAYCKYFLSVTFEAVTMALAIIVCNAFINAGLPTFTSSYAITSYSPNALLVRLCAPFTLPTVSAMVNVISQR